MKLCFEIVLRLIALLNIDWVCARELRGSHHKTAISSVRTACKKHLRAAFFYNPVLQLQLDNLKGQCHEKIVQSETVGS